MYVTLEVGEKRIQKARILIARDGNSLLGRDWLSVLQNTIKATETPASQYTSFILLAPDSDNELEILKQNLPKVLSGKGRIESKSNSWTFFGS